MEEKPTEKKREREEESPDMPPAKKAKIGNTVVIVAIAAGTSEPYSLVVRYCDECDILEIGKDMVGELILSVYKTTDTVSDMFPEKQGFSSYEELWDEYTASKTDEERVAVVKQLCKRVKNSARDVHGFYVSLSEETAEVSRNESSERCVTEEPISVMVCNCATKETKDITNTVLQAWLNEVEWKNLKYWARCKLAGKWLDE